VGQALLDRALEEARRAGAEYVWLGVWERNERGRRFWERQGFVEFGSHPFEFAGTSHTDLMMRRFLEAEGG
jgi:ribosomal protein S18 acetylase RimI-like enzyme